MNEGQIKSKNKRRGSIVSEIVCRLSEAPQAVDKPGTFSGSSDSCSGSLTRMTSSTGPTDGSVQASMNGKTE